MDINESLKTVLLGVVVLLFFLTTVDIVANEVFEAGGAGNISNTNLSASEANLLNLVPLIYVIIGIMIAVTILIKLS